MTTNNTAVETTAAEDNTVFFTKDELKSQIAADFGISKKLSNEIINAVQDKIAYAVVVEHKAYRLPGLGTLKVKGLPAGTARNPQDGSSVDVPEREKVVLRNKPYILVPEAE